MKSAFTTAVAPIVGLLLAGSTRWAGAQSVFAVNVRVVVSGGFSVETTAIDFGRITPGVAQVILPQAGGRQGAAGQVLISFNNDGVSVTIPGDMILAGPGAQIRATLTCAATPNREIRPATPFACADGFSFSADNRASGTNRPIIYVGGNVAASETLGKPAGIYGGAVVITASNTTT